MVGLDNPIHLLLLLMIVLLVFGAKRLPEMGRSLGSGLRGFKQPVNGEPLEEPRQVLSTADLEPASADQQPQEQTRPAA